MRAHSLARRQDVRCARIRGIAVGVPRATLEDDEGDYQVDWTENRLALLVTCRDVRQVESWPTLNCNEEGEPRMRVI